MKKIISITLAVTITLWLSGVAMLAPVSAITIVEGDIVSPDAEYTDDDGNAYYPYDVFIVKYVGAKKFKRLVLNPQVFDSYGHLEWGNIKTATVAEVQAFTTSELTRADGDDKVYKLFPDGDVGTKRWVETLDCFTTNSYDWDSVYIINSTDRDNYTTGAGLCGGGGEGDLSVSLASDTPVAATIPQSATSVGYIKVDFTAGSEGAVGITNLVFHRAGLGNVNDFDNLYLYEGASRLTDGRSVGAATNNVTFSGLTISIPAGETKSITLKADLLTSETYDYNYFELVSDSSIISDASTVTGIFPIKGYNMVLSGAAVVGTITIAALADPADPKVGETGATVAKFSLAADSEDMTLNELRLIVKGTIDNDDLTNLVLLRGTEELATDDALSSEGYMEFVLAIPYAFEDGDTKNFSVTADISGEALDTVLIYLDENTDLVAIGSDYGYGCGVTKTNYDGTATTKESDTALVAGKVTLVFNGPVAADVGMDTNDTVLMDFAITAAMFVTIKTMVVNIDGEYLVQSTTVNSITDLKIKNKDTGVTIQGPEELDAGVGENTDILTFAEDYDIQAGETLNLQITGDIGTYADGIRDADDFYVTIDISLLVIEDANRDTVSDIVPSGDIQSNEMTVAAATLAVTLSGTPTSKTFVTGKTDIETVGFNFAASEASDLEITDLILTGYIACEVASAADMDAGKDASASIQLQDIISSVSIYEGSNKIAGPETVTVNTGVVIFDGFSWTIPAGESKTMIVKADISTTAPYTGDDDLFAFDIATLNTDITVYDSDGDSLTVTDTGLNGTGTAPTIYQTISSGGSLVAAAASDKPRAAIIIAGNMGTVFNKVKFTSTNEAFVVEEILITKTGGAVANVKQVTLSYPTESGTRTQSMNLGVSNKALFTGATFYVPKDDNAILTIKADLNTIADGAVSAAGLTLDFTHTSLKAVGQSSSTILTSVTNEDSQGGNTMTLYRTKPTFSKQDIPGFTGVLIPTAQKVAIFTITADDNNDLVFSDASGSLKFDISASSSDGSEGSLKLYDWNNDVVASSGDVDIDSLSDITFNFNVSGASDGGDVVTIPEGTTKTFYVKADLINFGADGDYFKLILNDDEDGDIQFIDDDRAAYDVAQSAPANTVPGLDIDFETFVKE